MFANDQQRNIMLKIDSGIFLMDNESPIVSTMVHSAANSKHTSTPDRPMIDQVTFIHRFTLGAEEDQRRTKRRTYQKNQFREQIRKGEITDTGG